MSISSVDSAVSTIRSLEEYTSSSESTSSTGLDSDDFLQILVAEMTNQDPMNSTSNTEYISQLVQFSVLSSMEDMATALEKSQALDMVGKVAYIEATEDTDAVYGVVSGIVEQDGKDYLMIEDALYDPSDVTAILDSADYGVTDQEILEGANLVGKTVSITYADAESGESVTVSGKVDKITIEDGAISLVIGDVTIPLSSVEEISA